MHEGVVAAQRYRIERELGKGGMGAVYVALDQKFGEKIALKIATASASDYESFRARFAREAKIGNRLGKTQGFVRAFDWGEIGNGHLYLAMDLVADARSLDLKSGTLEERLARLRSGAVLVAEAHKQGVIHRDVKPANFLQGADGRIWLTDFGLAKVRGETDEVADSMDATSGVTGRGEALGTPSYMPPEQFDDAATCDERADVYALGVMLFLAVTGQLPIAGKSIVNFRKKQDDIDRGDAPLPRLRAFVPDAPPALDELAASAMAMDAAKRLPTSAAFVAGLDRIMGASATPSGRTAPLSASPAARATPSRAVPMAAAVLLVAALGGAAFLANGRHGPEATTDSAVPRPKAIPPAPIVKPTDAAPRFPDECRSVLESEKKAVRLSAVLGTFASPFRLRLQRVAILPDGKRCLVAAREHAFALWDLSASRFLPVQFDVAKSIPLTLALSPDGKTALAGGQDGELLLLDLETGRATPLQSDTTPMRSVAISRDGKLALTTTDGTVALWDLATRTRIAVAKTSYDRPGAVDFLGSKGTLRAFAAGGTAKIEVWRIEGGNLVPAEGFERDSPALSAVAVAPDGERLLLCYRSGAIVLMDGAGKTICSLVKPPAPIATGAVFLASAKAGEERVLAADAGGSLTVYRVSGSTATVEKKIANACRGASAIAASPDGRLAAVAGLETVPEITDLATGEPSRIPGDHGMIVSLQAIDSGRLASAGSDGAIKLWDAATGAELETVADQETIYQGGVGGGRFFANLIVGGPTSKELVAGAFDGKPRFSVTKNASVAAISSDGRWLAWGLADGSIGIRDLENRNLLPREVLGAHTGAVAALTFVGSASGALLLADGGADGRVIVRDAADLGRTLASRDFGTAKHEIRFLAASGADPRLLVVDQSGEVSLWNSASDQLVFRWRGEAPALRGALAPDMRRAVVTDSNAVATLLDMNGNTLDELDLRKCGEKTAFGFTLPVTFADERTFYVGTSVGPILRYELR